MNARPTEIARAVVPVGSWDQNQYTTVAAPKKMPMMRNVQP